MNLSVGFGLFAGQYKPSCPTDVHQRGRFLCFFIIRADESPIVIQSERITHCHPERRTQAEVEGSHPDKDTPIYVNTLPLVILD